MFPGKPTRPEFPSHNSLVSWFSMTTLIFTKSNDRASSRQLRTPKHRIWSQRTCNSFNSELAGTQFLKIQSCSIQVRRGLQSSYLCSRKYAIFIAILVYLLSTFLFLNLYCEDGENCLSLHYTGEESVCDAADEPWMSRLSRLNLFAKH